MDKVYNLPLMGYVDQQALGILFAIFCICISVLAIYKFHKNKTIISDEYICAAIITLVSYIYLRYGASYSFYHLIGNVAFTDVLWIPALTTMLLPCFRKPKQETLIEGIASNISYGTIPDNPIESEDDDELGFGKIIDALLDDIRHTDLKESFSIGIVGQWGQGKSSFANILRNRIDKNQAILIDFNPRNSKSSEAISEDFFNQFADALSPYHTNIKTIIRKYANALQIALSDNWLKHCLSAIQELTPVDTKDDINHEIKEIGRTIIVIVDDLDRLTAKEILEVLKLIDRNADFTNTVFITAYDKEYVNDVLKHYLGYKTDNFTDKYFNYEVSLPVPDFYAIYSVFQKCLSKTSYEPVRTNLLNFWREEGNQYIKYFENVRHIKRFVNILQNRYRDVYRDVYVPDFFGLTILRYFDITTYNKLATRNFLNTGSRAVRNNPIRYYLNSDIMLPEGHWEHTPELLDMLFPHENSESIYRRICDADFFDLYFYDYKEGKIYQKDLADLFHIGDSSQAIAKLEDYKAKDRHGLYRFLQNVSTGWLGTRERLERYLLLCFQYRTDCEIKDHSLFASLGDPLFEESYKQYVQILDLSSKQDYISAISKIYSSFITKYPFQLQQLVQGLYSEEKDEVCILGEDFLKELGLKCQKTFFEQFDENKNTAIEIFAVSLLRKQSNGKSEPETSRELLKFMNEHRDFIARNIFHWYPNFSDDGRHRHITCCFEDLYESFTPWFPTDGTTFTDWLNTIENETLRNILIATYNAPTKRLSVNALKKEYDKNDYEGIWTAIQYDKDNTDMFNLEKWVKVEDVYDLSTLSQISNISKDRIKELIDKYQGKGMNLPDYLLKDTEPFEIGDIVKLKTNVEKALIKDRPCFWYLYKIDNIFDNNTCKLDTINDPVKISDLLPVKVDGKDDKDIYYDPVVAASIVMPGHPIPIHDTNYDYYLDSLKKSFRGNKSEYDIIKEHKFNYVHEIQHFLRKGTSDDGLKIRI